VLLCPQIERVKKQRFDSPTVGLSPSQIFSFTFFFSTLKKKKSVVFLLERRASASLLPSLFFSSRRVPTDLITLQ